MSAAGMPREPGSRLLEEIVLLLDAVAERLGPWLDRVAAAEPGQRADSGCCPLCALTAVFRGEPNELAASTLDRAVDLVALLRAVLADRWEPGVPHMPGFQPTAGTTARSGAAEPTPPESAPKPSNPSRVQRIPVRRGFGPG